MRFEVIRLHAGEDTLQLVLARPAELDAVQSRVASLLPGQLANPELHVTLARCSVRGLFLPPFRGHIETLDAPEVVERDAKTSTFLRLTPESTRVLSNYLRSLASQTSRPDLIERQRQFHVSISNLTGEPRGSVSSIWECETRELWVDVQSCIARAEAAAREADLAKASVVTMLQDALRTQLKPGVIVDCNRMRGLPSYLWDTKVLRGNDRGSRVFRIESDPVVDLEMAHVGLARWHCSATPISEKTGKPMSGMTHGANAVAGAGTVGLHGHVFNFHLLASDAQTRPPEQFRAAEMEAIARFVRSPDPLLEYTGPAAPVKSAARRP